MKAELIHTLTNTFAAHAQKTENGIEFWLARDLQKLLGYNDWRNFLNAINKAKIACEASGHKVSDHFVDVNKMVDLGSGSQRDIDDIMLTRYACYRSRKLPSRKLILRFKLAEQSLLNNGCLRQSVFQHVKSYPLPKKSYLV